MAELLNGPVVRPWTVGGRTGGGQEDIGNLAVLIGVCLCDELASIICVNLFVGLRDVLAVPTGYYRKRTAVTDWKTVFGEEERRCGLR